MDSPKREPYKCTDDEKSVQVDRPISTGQLNTLRYLHLQPINLVVFKGSDRDI